MAPANVDDWSEIRDLHASAFRHLVTSIVATTECDAFAANIYEPNYTIALQEQQLTIARYDRHLVGTAGWIPHAERKGTARITAIYVSPLFARLGFGRRLVANAEQLARLSGYSSFTVHTFEPAIGFFQRLGYLEASHHKIEPVTDGSAPPVVRMHKIAPAIAGILASPALFAILVGSAIIA